MMTNHPGPIIAQRDNLTAIDCQACGYAHLSDFPSELELARYYESDFWQHTKAGALAEFERAAEWWAAVHGDWLSICEQHTDGRELLDIGAGFGFFLKAAHLRHWSARGIEPSREAVIYASDKMDISLWHSSWEETRDLFMDKYSFDCISAHWVIEHLPDPLQFLCQARECLNPGGVLLTVIPQEWTEAQARANEIVNKKSWWLDPTHLNYFSQTSFANLLGRAGFRIVDMLASYPMENFIIDMGSNYVDNPALGSLCHRAIEKIELGQTREERIQEARERARYGRGRDLIVVAKKD